ncbi:hypothetical protein [Bounagaea algeriensis]
MRLALTAATAGLAVLALAGCEQPSPGSAPQLDMPQPDAPIGADPDEYGPLLPATPDGPAEAPDPQMPDEVTAYCHGGDIVDFKPKTPEAQQRAQGICADQQTYEEHGFTEPDPRGPGGGTGDADQFQQDMQQWLDDYTTTN